MNIVFMFHAVYAILPQQDLSQVQSHDYHNSLTANDFNECWRQK